MGGVDTLNQYCGSYAFSRKSVKWQRKLFFWTLEVALVNSFILWNIDRKEKKLPEEKHKKFRKQVLIQLIGDVRNIETRKGSSTEGKERLTGKHFIAKMEGKKFKDCALCSNRKI